MVISIIQGELEHVTHYLLFFLIEDALSMSIYKLAKDEAIELINGTKYTYVSSHVFYADDILLFCIIKLSNIHALTNLFTYYSEVSCQIFSTIKSIIFFNLISRRLDHIISLTSFFEGTLTFDISECQTVRIRLDHHNCNLLCINVLSSMMSATTYLVLMMTTL